MITNKEAINRLKEIIEEVKLCGVEQGNKDIEALDLAIKALEERPQGDKKEALFVLNHLFYDCDNMTQKEYDILLEAIKEADNE